MQSLVIQSGMRLAKMEHGSHRSIVGKLFFRNMDDEWEQFPDDQQLYLAQQSAHDLQALGFAIICQLCNEPPTVSQIKLRALQNAWKCDKCGTMNSAGKA
jgi:hypothetical protein